MKGATPVGPDEELRALLHAEIGRLPDRFRLPVVLCDLEGLTRDQAAERLRWTEGTVRGRLARARALLRERLTRRGVVVPAGVLAVTLASEAATAAVPDALLIATVRAAAGQGVTAIVAVFTAQVLRSMFPVRVKLGAAFVLAAAAVAWASALLLVPTEARPPQDPPAAREAMPVPAEQPVVAQGLSAAGVESGETAEVRGQVVDPAGKPVMGATIQVDNYLNRTVKPPGGGAPAVSGADGRYTLTTPRDMLERFSRGDESRPRHLVASAPGYGPGWAEAADASGVLKDVTLRLAADDVPIEGRILDLEGRPVAGAEIVTSDLYDPPGGDLTPWIEGMKANPTGPHEGGLQQVPFAVRRTTGPDGRFRLDGVGRERVVMFTVAGPTIALTRTFAMTKDVPPVRSSNTHIIGPRTMIFHGARFDFAVEPCKPVVGIIRDLDTGAPLAGIRVNGMAYEERSRAYYHEVESITDEQGRYRLTGMAKAEKYRLALSAGKGQPYCNASFVEPAATPGLEPATIDLRLKRGVLVRGRITDKRTGKPTKGGSVDSFAMRDNPHVNDYPGFLDSGATTVYPDEDGRFAIAALPGRGMLGVRGGSERYLRGVGAEAIQGKDSRASLPAYPGFPFAGNYNLVAAFDAGAGSEPVVLDLQLDRGRALSVTVVDPDGQPVPGCRAFGTRSMTYWDRRPLDAATFEVTALDPRQTRHVMLYHESRRLGGSTLIEKDQEGPLTVRLQPCGVVTGRLVDEDGQPRRNLDVVSTTFFDAEPNGGVFHRSCPVDRDGRFRIEVIPGLSYTSGAQRDRGMIIGKVFARLTLGPGEVKDVGDVMVKMPSGQ